MKMRKRMLIHVSGAAMLTLVGAMTVSCGSKGQAGMNGAVPEFAVITVNPEQTELNIEHPAKLRGRQDIEIRPNVSGFITKLSVDEGSTVHRGQVLFVIDPVQYEEAVKVAEASVNVAKSSVATAQLTAENKRELFRKNIISDYDLQLAENTLASQKSALAQAQAQLTNARKNLSYTRVTSPSDGVVGKIPFRVGSLVSPSMVTPLTTVSDISEMFAYFSLNEKELLQLMSSDGQKSMEQLVGQMPEVSLRLPDGTIYSAKGKVKTVSGVIDDGTGASSVRAAFPNAQRILRSGGSAVVLIPQVDSTTLVIPQSAVSEIQDKRYAYVLTDSSTVKQTEIEIMPVDDGQRFVVTSGLNPGDRVVVEGVGISVKDGMKVKPITPEEAQAKYDGAIQQTQGGAPAAGQAAKKGK